MLFLGHWISKGVIQMDQEKIRSVVDWEVPKKERTAKQNQFGRIPKEIPPTEFRVKNKRRGVCDKKFPRSFLLSFYANLSLLPKHRRIVKSFLRPKCSPEFVLSTIPRIKRLLL
ncbi:hypothetical protein F0562_017098 [Nyssa sinensis]|uniref:Uncharacterized protein n=1 Tax=Nyssa sinensis TaxID=561372 RepID=A0A5J4ZGR1_9ASTE|nr:hypothetical protein F0562_017098 [Nyssa sinensis]